MRQNIALKNNACLFGQKLFNHARHEGHEDFMKAELNDPLCSS